MKDLQLPGWFFYYETTIKNLPFKFTWASPGEEAEQQDRRPDGVAYNEVEGVVIFLEFTRAMDNPDNMERALQEKGKQYKEVMEALERAQQHGRLSTCPALPPSPQLSLSLG